MILRILPEQVVKQWGTLAQGIEESLPPYVRAKHEIMVNVLYAVLNEDLIVWGYYENEELVALCFTGIHIEPVTRVRCVLVYSIYAYRPIGASGWLEFTGFMKRYAASIRCSSIIAFSETPEVIKLCEFLGAETSWRLIEFNLGD